jgi:hypothetical protein
MVIMARARHRALWKAHSRLPSLKNVDGQLVEVSRDELPPLALPPTGIVRIVCGYLGCTGRLGVLNQSALWALLDDDEVALDGHAGERLPNGNRRFRCRKCRELYEVPKWHVYQRLYWDVAARGDSVVVLADTDWRIGR